MSKTKRCRHAWADMGEKGYYQWVSWCEKCGMIKLENYMMWPHTFKYLRHEEIDNE